MFGWILGLVDLVNPLVSGLLLAVYGAIVGAVIGALLGLVAHALTGGWRDFASVSAVRADSYDLLVEDTHADQGTSCWPRPAAPAYPSTADRRSSTLTSATRGGRGS